MRFRSHVAADAVRGVACGLRPSLAVGGESHPVDVQVGTVPCGASASAEGALSVRVDVEPEEVVVRLEVPEGTSPEALRELEQGLRDIEAELARRVASIPRPLPPRIGPAPAPPTKRSKKWFVATAIIGGIGAGAAATAGIMVGVGTANRDNGLKDTGETILVSFVAPMGVAALITLIVAGALAVGGD
jgi:hypothetical protein